MTGAHSIVNKLYPAAALPAPALAGHFTPEEDGAVSMDLLQNSLALAPAHPDDSRRLGYLTCTTPSDTRARLADAVWR